MFEVEQIAHADEVHQIFDLGELDIQHPRLPDAQSYPDTQRQAQIVIRIGISVGQARFALAAEHPVSGKLEDIPVVIASDLVPDH